MTSGAVFAGSTSMAAPFSDVIAEDAEAGLRLHHLDQPYPLLEATGTSPGVSPMSDREGIVSLVCGMLAGGSRDLR